MVFALLTLSGFAGIIAIVAFFLNGDRGAKSELLVLGIVLTTAALFTYLKGDVILNALSKTRTESEQKSSAQRQNEERQRTADKHDQNKTPKAARRTTSQTQDSHYAAVLGVTSGSEMKQIHAAYLARVSEYHPDKVAHLGPKLQSFAEEETKKINEAYAHFKAKNSSRA